MQPGARSGSLTAYGASRMSECLPTHAVLGC